MDQFEYVMVLVSIIIGLGIAHVLFGIGGIIDRLASKRRRLELSLQNLEVPSLVARTVRGSGPSQDVLSIGARCVARPNFCPCSAKHGPLIPNASSEVCRSPNRSRRPSSSILPSLPSPHRTLLSN